MNVKIIVATHKKYPMPNDKMYFPIQVGAEGKNSLGYQADNTGDNISKKNPYFCELTGLYWAWKNLDADYIGLAHYRRHFKGKNKSKNKFDMVLKENELAPILHSFDIVLPKERKYYIESIYSHYSHTHYEKDLKLVRTILMKKYPRYVDTFDTRMKLSHAHMFNMFIMKKSFLDDYCSFLFDVLFELETMIDIEQYDAFQARLFGRISELLLDVWLDANHLEYTEIPVMHMEKINWVQKGGAFLKAKFLKKKYKGSF